VAAAVQVETLTVTLTELVHRVFRVDQVVALQTLQLVEVEPLVKETTVVFQQGLLAVLLTVVVVAVVVLARLAQTLQAVQTAVMAAMAQHHQLLAPL
jgi:hypothetical protein